MMPARELNSLADAIHAAIKADKRTPMGIAFAVAASGFGSAELVRLQSLMNAQPADLSEAQLEALIDAGNAALSDYYHDRACACSDYPESCYTNPAYARAKGFWDTDAFAVGAPAVIGLWEVLRAADTAGEVAVLNAALAHSEARITALEKDLREARAARSEYRDDLVAAVGRDVGGCDPGTEWCDLIDIATTAVRTAQGIETAGAKALRAAEARVAELEAERHTTNEALADVTEALRPPEQASPVSAFAAANAHIRGDECTQCKPSNRLPEQCPEGQRLSRLAMGSLVLDAAVGGAPC